MAPEEPIETNEAVLAACLIIQLGSYVDTHRIGVVTSSDGVYHFPGAETGLVPDVEFYRAECLAEIVDEDKPMPFPPDLAVEVASPSQTATQMAAKARVYLRAGTRLVWVVWPQSAHIDVWHAGMLTGPVAGLTLSDTLTVEAVVAGFSYPVADLFTDPLRPEP